MSIDRDELIRLIREDEGVQSAVLDMLSENVDVNLEGSRNDDGYSSSYGDVSGMDITITFGERMVSIPRQDREYNANEISASGYF
jgi:hypothetical protein